MEQYHNLLKKVLGEGDVVFEPRTQEFTIGLGGFQSVYDLREGFPLVTTKKVNIRLLTEELFWKLRGGRSVKPLFDRNVHIWDGNAYQHYLKRKGLDKNILKHTKEWENGFEKYLDRLKKDPNAEKIGDLGPVYGFQWRHGFKKNGEGIDQLKKVLEGIKKRPGSRYHLMSAWNPADLDNSAIGPCPMIHQFNVFGDNLDLHVYQRSCDVFLGVPFNIAQDSLFNHMVAKETGLNARYFFHTYGNVHTYLGVAPRSDFWIEPEIVSDFQERFREINKREKYLELKKWYLDNTMDEKNFDKGKDHIPFILTQLSKKPKNLPKLELADYGFWDSINLNMKNVVNLLEYNPYNWESKARMAE